MHRHDRSIEALDQAIVDYSIWRVRLDPPPLDGPRSPAELDAAAGQTITPQGIGGIEAMRIFADVLAPACISVDHPRHLSFVPGAPTEASVLFDLVVGASNIYAGSWVEGAGAVWAENQALAWIADLAGFPAGAGGVFVSGGTAGNLSALLAARWQWRHEHPEMDAARPLIIASSGSHSSVAQAARVMDADIVMADEIDDNETDGLLTEHSLRQAIERLPTLDRVRIMAIVATGGTTNAGIVEDLAGAASAAADLDVWLHIDAAYGGAALCAPSVRHRFDGIERADSFIVDPHKWLFAPFDSCALVYRDPAIARAAHTQHAGYLDVLHGTDQADEPWNTSDLAHHLSRRARGLPLWFSLATHGTDAYRDAVETTLAVARRAAELIDADPLLELIMEPQLSVVLFRRVGWGPNDYRAWSDRLLADGVAFVVPTSWRGETMLRFCIVNPLTSVADIELILETLA